jgi:hypothetical protein
MEMGGNAKAGGWVFAKYRRKARLVNGRRDWRVVPAFIGAYDIVELPQDI